jgi:hypothetical protein
MPPTLLMRMRKIQVLSDERPSNAHMPLYHAEPGVLHHLVRDGAIGDVKAGDAAEARMIVVNEARKRDFVTTAQRFDHAPIVGRRDRRAS